MKQKQKRILNMGGFMDWFLQQHLIFKEGAPCKQQEFEFKQLWTVVTFASAYILVAISYLFTSHSFGLNSVLMGKDCLYSVWYNTSTALASPYMLLEWTLLTPAPTKKVF